MPRPPVDRTREKEVLGLDLITQQTPEYNTTPIRITCLSKTPELSIGPKMVRGLELVPHLVLRPYTVGRLHERLLRDHCVRLHAPPKTGNTILCALLAHYYLYLNPKSRVHYTKGWNPVDYEYNAKDAIFARTGTSYKEMWMKSELLIIDEADVTMDDMSLYSLLANADFRAKPFMCLIVTSARTVTPRPPPSTVYLHAPERSLDRLRMLSVVFAPDEQDEFIESWEYTHHVRLSTPLRRRVKALAEGHPSILRICLHLIRKRVPYFFLALSEHLVHLGLIPSSHELNSDKNLWFLLSAFLNRYPDGLHPSYLLRTDIRSALTLAKSRGWLATSADAHGTLQTIFTTNAHRALLEWRMRQMSWQGEGAAWGLLMSRIEACGFLEGHGDAFLRGMDFEREGVVVGDGSVGGGLGHGDTDGGFVMVVNEEGGAATAAT
ncbi:hypothetical protein SAICODRAFT_131750 [Saitoella complicata NRRL Y-17804]|uniref:Uncharacterized protein n=1 Tax=Saitoella complicata (strain BCRC 22490 / CBS 7301 / JCM 7358 / NBRC 10748 / NRRL Y-17804) TaxID=698492 RepID=A0A0E9NSJ9_SAICN|nr:uncharacterized protein SAICODRAFT_131750 [Saitoella complicata NRRL Y-17804]ODQ52227.1 hypothetical protein SAICODRAFT_131750 [Saitoella complicata NRRL Y-17804]GAO52646.1 hypothetical protein G7K_6718-t1 [Saitoella complicata NRRL Y-17804]